MPRYQSRDPQQREELDKANAPTPKKERRAQAPQQHSGMNGSWVTKGVVPRPHPQVLLGLQRGVGNQAVVQMLRRSSPASQRAQQWHAEALQEERNRRFQMGVEEAISRTQDRLASPPRRIARQRQEQPEQSNRGHLNNPASPPVPAPAPGEAQHTAVLEQPEQSSPASQRAQRLADEARLGAQNTEAQEQSKQEVRGKWLPALEGHLRGKYGVEPSEKVQSQYNQEVRAQATAQQALTGHFGFKHNLPVIEAKELEPSYQVGNPYGGEYMGTKYLSPPEAQDYKLSVTGGKVKKRKKSPSNSTDPKQNARWFLEDFDTTTIAEGMHGANGLAIYVLSQEGDLYSGEGKKFLFHHSSLLAGTKVAAAGEIKVVNGEVTQVSNTSGHYAPEVKYLKNILAKLEAGGVALATVDVVEDEYSECDHCNNRFAHGEERRMKAVDWLERHKPAIPDRANEPPLPPPTRPSWPVGPPTAQKWRAHYAWRAQDQKEELVGQHRANKPTS